MMIPAVAFVLVATTGFAGPGQHFQPAATRPPAVLLHENFSALPAGPTPARTASEVSPPVLDAARFHLPKGWRHYGEIAAWHDHWAPEAEGWPLPLDGLRWYVAETPDGRALTKDPWDAGKDGWYGPTSLPSNQWALAPLAEPMRLDGGSVYVIRLRFQFDHITGPFATASESNRIDLALFEGAVAPLESLPAMSRDVRAMVTYRMNATGEWGVGSNLHTHFPNGDGPIDGHLVYREFSPVAVPVRWRNGGLQGGILVRHDMRNADLTLADPVPPNRTEDGWNPQRTNRGMVTPSDLPHGEAFGPGMSEWWRRTEGRIWETWWILRGPSLHDHYVRDPFTGAIRHSFSFRRPAVYHHPRVTHVAMLYRPEVKRTADGGFAMNRTFIHDVEVRRIAPGDLDVDGVVTEAELHRLTAAFGTTGGWFEGDFNGDGRVDAADALLALDAAGPLRDSPAGRVLAERIGRQ